MTWDMYIKNVERLIWVFLDSGVPTLHTEKSIQSNIRYKAECFYS